MILLHLGATGFGGFCWGQDCSRQELRRRARGRARHTGVPERTGAIPKLSDRRGRRSACDPDREGVGYPRG
jgi:hypothetical protein